ncbi:hypothetical protein BH18ACT12_BH18ACT12_09210 [soil metagenome]
MPRRIVVVGVSGDVVTKRDMFNGKRQTIRFAFFVKDSLFSWAVKSHFRRRRSFPQLFSEHPGGGARASSLVSSGRAVISGAVVA